MRGGMDLSPTTLEITEANFSESVALAPNLWVPLLEWDKESLLYLSIGSTWDELSLDLQHHCQFARVSHVLVEGLEELPVGLPSRRGGATWW